ncbi:MAG: hypothetical protein KDC48_22265, partial [Planctomycetes bacterium]|nr:hypothetical protein [Planctomycetota bacterium]
AADAVEFGPGPLHPTPVARGNHSPSGAYGDPTRATADKGRQLLAAILDDLEEAIDAAVERSAT